MGKLLPIILAVVGIGGGIGAGLALRPAPVEHVEINPCGETEMATHEQPEDAHAEEHDPASTSEFVKFANQFVVPVVAEDLVTSMVVMSVSLETTQGQTEAVFLREPKIRDAFLQVLFDHANIGGFDGEFTNARNMSVLRDALTDTARDIVGNVVLDVLITDIARQDV